MQTPTNPFTARWTAQGNTLCLGHWEISYQDTPLVLPNKIRENHMNTFGIFSFLFPDEEDFAEGWLLEKWIEENFDWLEMLFQQHKVPLDEQHVQWFYESVNQQDWRCGSCGGCL
ncbi:MAG: hypothetical protein ACFHVJ_02665 [Aestuariibacter sp.]